MIVRACLRSGFCCRRGPCGFGAPVSSTNPQCQFLIEHDDKTTSCGKHDEIIKDPSSVFSPAFGSGCCMPMFNEARTEILMRDYDGVEQYIEIKPL